jgi:hypothetical protein
MSASPYHAQAASLTLSPYTRDIGGIASPRQAQPANQAPVPKGPVPKFTKCLNVSDLQPQINEQPPFRRAKPEGGYLSVCFHVVCKYQAVFLTTRFVATSSVNNAAACYLPNLQS